MGVDLGTYRARIGAFGASISASLYSIMGASQLLLWSVMAALLKLSGDVEENPGPPKLSEKPETIEDWDPARLKLWLQDNGLDQKYCDRMCQEEVDGLAFFWYTKEDLSKDFQIKKGPMQILSHLKSKVQLKEISQEATQNIQQWLESLHMPAKYIQVFINEEVDEESLGLMTEEDLSKDFGLTKGPLRKILYSASRRTPSRMQSSQCSNQALETWTADMVTQWLRSVNFPEKYTSVMNEDEVNGVALQCYTESELQNDFSMKKGPVKWLLSLRDQCIISSDSSSLSQNEDSPILEPTIQAEEMSLDRLQLSNKQEEAQVKEVKSVSVGEVEQASDYDIATKKASKEKTVPEDSKETRQTSEKETDQMFTSHELQSILALPFKEYHPAADSNYANADIQLIFSRWGSKENSLAKLMCFCVLIRDNFPPSSSFQTTLWRNICNSLPSWHQFMGEAEKKRFCIVPNKSDALARVEDSQPISLKMQKPTMCHLGVKTMLSIRKRPNVFFLAHQSFLTEENTSYNICIKPGDDRSRVVLTFSKCHRWHASFDAEAALTFNSEVNINLQSTRSAGEDSPCVKENVEGAGKTETMSKDVNDDSTSQYYGKLNRDDTTVISDEDRTIEGEKLFEDKDENKEDDVKPPTSRAKVNDQQQQDEHHQSIQLTQTYTQPVQQEELRPFDKAVGPFYYRQHRILNVIETGRENLIDPVHEFKEFTEAAQQPALQQMQKFLFETLRFACGMLNTRSNGTIHFGISDDAKIIGIPVSRKAEFEEKLGHYKEKCFQGTATKAAADCIRPPKFVLVKGASTVLYVIEIDVVPSIAHCKGKSFLVKLPSFQPAESKSAKITLEKEEVLFVRKESSTISLKGLNQLAEFIQNQMPTLDAERESAEKQAVIFTRQTSTTSLAEKFIRLLCCNQKTLDASFFPILVVNTPEEKFKESLNSLRESFRFLQDIDWVAVFDFDPRSLEDGLCNLYREKKDNILGDPSTFGGKSDLSELMNEVQFPEVTSWIFCNGRAHVGEGPFDRMDWNRKRSRGIKDAVRFFCRENVVPAGRAIVVFCLLSDEIELMLEVFFEFHSFLGGVNYLMCVSESHDTFHSWIKEIAQKCDREEVLDRSVVGMPWDEVQEEVLQMKGLSHESQCFIPTPAGSRRVLKDRDKNMLRDLEVISQNECDSTPIEKDKEAFEIFRKEKELQFYKGHKVEWWNFWFTDKHYNQVLQREKFDELKDKVYDKLKLKDSELRMGTVNLYHQPGAGGSTLARHVLWHCRKKYRCCVVKKITEDTCNQILKLRDYGEQNTELCLPVLVLVEDIDEMELRDLCAGIESAAAHRGIRCASLVSVVLYCKIRDLETPPTGRSSRQATSGDFVLLDQELSEGECNWFTMKLKSLEDDPEGLEMYDPRHMISFMILKENFNPDYVKKTVKGILEGIDRPEKSLLKYIALLNSYVADSSVAVACCDCLMGISHFNVRKNQDWEFLLSKSAKLLLLEMQKFSLGSVKAFKMVHPLVAREVLDQLKAQDCQSMSQVALEFLGSKLFQTKSYAKKDLVEMTTEMLKKRKKIEYGDDYNTAFSPFIDNIISCESYHSAAEVLIEGSSCFAEDSFLTQQIARVYIKAKDFDKALTFAKKAVDKNPTNSFILDTLGQVYKEQLMSKYTCYVSYDQILTPADAIEAIVLAFNAMNSFRQSQDANEKAYNADNEAGYHGELSVCFKLLDILMQVDEFSRQEKRLRRYLTIEEDKPPSIALPWAVHHKDLKSLKLTVGQSLEWITDYVTTFKSAPNNDYDNLRLRRIKGNYFDHYDNYRKYFGEQDSSPPPELEAKDLNEWRRRRVIHLGGDHFRNIFELVTEQTEEAKAKLLQIKNLLKENEPRNYFDLKNLISVNLALSCLDSNIRGIASCQELFEMAKCLLQLSQVAEARSDLYPYYFLSMFLWPREDMKIEYHNLMFQDALNGLKDCYQAREKRMESSQYGMRKMARKWQGRPRKPITLFFLSKGKGLQAFVHISKLSVSNPASLGKKDHRDRFWHSPRVNDCLLQLSGILKDRNTLLAQNMMMGDDSNKRSIEVQLSIPIDSPGFSQEPVTFYLGFSWEGPVAYNVERYNRHEGKAIDYPVGQKRQQKLEADSGNEGKERIRLEDLKKQQDKLNKKLQSIKDLKTRRRSGETLERNQIDKIKDEKNVRHQLEEVIKKIEGHWMEQSDDFT